MKRTLTVVLICFFFFGFSQTKEQDSLSIAVAFQSQDSSKVDTSIALIKSLYNTQDYSKAIQYINEVEKLATKISYDKRLAEVHFYKALIYTANNDYYNALDSYEDSKKFYNKISDSLGLAKANNNIGLIEIKRGNYNRGLQYSLSAIKIFEAKNLRKELSNSYSNLAEAYYNTGSIDKALEFNQKALAVRAQLLDEKGIKESTKNIADLYSEKREHRKAIEYYNKTLELLEPKTDVLIEGDVLPKLGEEYLHLRDFDKASEYLLKGLQLNREQNNKLGILKSYNALAYLNFQNRKFKTSNLQLDRASALIDQVNNDQERIKNYKYRMRVDSALGNYRNAYFWQNKYYDLKQELDRTKLNANTFINSNNEDITNINPTPQTINLSSKEKAELIATNEKKLDKFKYIAYGLGAAFLAALGIALFMYYRQKDNTSRVKELEIKHKEMLVKNKDAIEQSKHLEETNQVKDRLFSIVSHDLKDSVSSIKGCLDLMKEGSLSKSEFKELIPELSDNADNASQLLFDLLNWSKTQMQNLEPNPEAFDVQEIFKSKIHLVEQKIEQKRVVLIDESKPEMAYADKNMIEIVVQNLIANAIKFSRVGDVITLTNRERNGKVLLCIEDTGVGISEENQKKIFSKENFTTLGTDNEKGTGLGLSICKELVELNNGRIWVQSEENFGSKFFIELPKAT